MYRKPFKDKEISALGYGGLRFPMEKDNPERIDREAGQKLIDAAIAGGINFFDTAYTYQAGDSEKFLGEALSKYPRDSYYLSTKFYADAGVTIEEAFETQLARCGVDYFDFYLMHAQSAEIFQHFKKCHAYETALQLKEEGKIRHFGISFHDRAEVLEEILKEYPQIEVVQIQFNYLDYEDPAVQSRKCYEVCRKYGKKVLIMEPVKGGNLVKLPEDAKKILDDLHGGSPASYALRYAAGFDGVLMVLSGMSNLEQMMDNISFMKNFEPLNEKELEAVHQVADIFHQKHMIPCTACRYCVAGCPKHISIPDLFSCMNAKMVFHDWNADYYYNMVHTARNGKASECVKCGKCEKVCPQHLKIREILEDVAKEFEKPRQSEK